MKKVILIQKKVVSLKCATKHTNLKTETQQNKIADFKMKNLANNTKNFLKEVKEVLDNSSWDYDFSGHDNYEDTDKAISYLNTQIFSIKVIKEELENIWEAFKENLKHNEIRSHEEAVKLAASMIANDVAFSRISKFKQNSNSDIYSKKWYISETVVFKI